MYRQKSESVSVVGWIKCMYADVLSILSSHVETVCLLSNRKSKPDSYVDLSINMEDYHRIKNEEK